VSNITLNTALQGSYCLIKCVMCEEAFAFVFHRVRGEARAVTGRVAVGGQSGAMPERGKGKNRCVDSEGKELQNRERNNGTTKAT
jgi:hypothetical protein